MVEKSFNAIFAKNLRNFLKINGMTQKELAKRLSVGTSSASSWCRGEKSPRMEKVDAMCKIFNCTRADLAAIYSGINRQYDASATLNARKK